MWHMMVVQVDSATKPLTNTCYENKRAFLPWFCSLRQKTQNYISKHVLKKMFTLINGQCTCSMNFKYFRHVCYFPKRFRSHSDCFSLFFLFKGNLTNNLHPLYMIWGFPRLLSLGLSSAYCLKQFCDFLLRLMFRIGHVRSLHSDK